MSTAERRDGGIRVRTDEVGRPVEIHLENAQLGRSAEALGADILALCRIAGTRAGVEQRARLAAAGVPATALADLGLPTRDHLADLEDRFDDDDDEVGSWMRSL